MFFFTAILVHPKVQPDGMMYGPMVWSNDVWRLPELQWVFVTATVSEAGSHGKPSKTRFIQILMICQCYPSKSGLKF